MSIVRPTLALSRTWPCSSRSTSSLISVPTRAASGPSTVISLPRTKGLASNDASMSRSSSSRCPRRPTMRWFSGWILTWVWDTEFVLSVPVGRGAKGLLGSPGGPPQAFAAENVHVEVRHRVEGVVADIEDQPVTAVGDALEAGDLLGG